MVGLVKVPKFDFDVADWQVSLEQYLEMNLEWENRMDDDSEEFLKEFDISLIYENKEARLAGVATKQMKEKLDRESAEKRGLSQRSAQSGASAQRSAYKTAVDIQDWRIFAIFTTTWKRCIKIARSGFVPMRKGSDNVEYQSIFKTATESTQRYDPVSNGNIIPHKIWVVSKDKQKDKWTFGLGICGEYDANMNGNVIAGGGMQKE